MWLIDLKLFKQYKEDKLEIWTEQSIQGEMAKEKKIFMDEMVVLYIRVLLGFGEIT